MRSFTIVTLVFFVATVTVQSQTKMEWTVDKKGFPNPLDLTAATYNQCHAYIQRDGNVRFNASGTFPGFQGEMFQSIKLGKDGNNHMVITDEFWTTKDKSEFFRANSLKPNLFYRECGEAVLFLPPNFLSALHGWRPKIPPQHK